MEGLIRLIAENEDWLIKKILAYAKQHGYTKYTSTLEEAWRLSINGLSASLIAGIGEFEAVPDFGPDEAFQRDALTGFGVIEAKRHRERGISLAMFLGLMKYYKQSYIDLLLAHGPSAPELEAYRLFLERSFDRIEIAFSQEWVRTGEEELLAELQEKNRTLTNEKNSYLTVFESLADPVIIVDTSGAIAKLNHAAALLLSPHHVPGTSYYRRGTASAGDTRENAPGSYVGLDFCRTFPWLCDAWEQREKAPQCVIDRPPSGSAQKSYEVSFAKSLDVSDKFSGTIISIRDITDRKLTEKRLAESEILYRTMVETANDWLWQIDRNGKYTYASPKVSELLGYAPEEVIGKTPFEFMPPEEAERVAPIFRDIVAKKIAFSGFENTNLHRDGRRVVLETSGRPIVDANGNFVGYSGVDRDITDRKNTQLALQQSKQLLQEVLDTIPVGVFWKDRNLKYLGCNRHCAINAGLSEPDEIVGKDDFQLAWHDYAEIYRQDDLNVLESGVAKINVEEIIVYPNGSKGWVKTNKIPLRDADGNITALLGCYEDITASKQAKDAAEAASKAKSDFLASMSHEIRTPLNAIIGMADLLGHTELSAQQQEYVHIFQSAGEHLLQIINDILDFSKIEAGFLELEQTDFNLNELLENTCDILALKAHEKGLELLHHIDSQVFPHVIGDPNRLRQILTNLIGNAIKFTDQGEVVLQVANYDINEESSFLLFSVSDTGIGIAEDKQDLIFDYFSQADSSTTRKFGGTGLGLAVSKRLVEKMDGRIWVDSIENTGSTFFFTAQLHRQDRTEKRDEPSRQEIDFTNLRPLIIDDSYNNRLILKQMLAGWGMVAAEAADGAEGLEMLTRAKRNNSPFDLVLLDCRMPGMDGFSVAAAINENTELRSIPVMMLTSDCRAEHIARAKSVGVDSYLVKPVKRSALFATISELVAPKPVRAQAAHPETIPARPARTLKILLAEDDRINQQMAVKMLELHGHQVDAAQNGFEAIERFNANTYDLILMDINMPKMDGYEATARIRQLEAENGGHIPIIALTAQAFEKDRKQCLEAGMDGYVAKPIRRKRLMEEIGRFFLIEQQEPLGTNSTNAMTRIGNLSFPKQVFDLEDALAGAEDDKDLLIHLARIFLADIPAYLASIEQAMNEENRAALRKAAHKLKGAVGNFGGKNVFHRALSLERSSHAASFAMIGEEFFRLREDLKLLETALIEFSREATP